MDIYFSFFRFFYIGAFSPFINQISYSFVSFVQRTMVSFIIWSTTFLLFAFLFSNMYYFLYCVFFLITFFLAFLVRNLRSLLKMCDISWVFFYHYFQKFLFFILKLKMTLFQLIFFLSLNQLWLYFIPFFVNIWSKFTLNFWTFVFHFCLTFVYACLRI